MLHNMASLFGKNKLHEIANRLNASELEDKIAIARTWHNDYHNGSLKADKETSREQAYNQDFFVKILGYTEKPAVPYSLEPKATTEKGQLPDAVLSHTDVSKDIKNIAAVVELKGASIELDRPQRRDGNMSPVQQAFKYKTQYRNCPFVIVSNFWEFRLYQDNQLDYELWTLDDLVDPTDDYLKFKTFYALLHSNNLTTPKGASKTEGWLSDIRFEQEEIGKKFYKVYRDARLDLLRDIYQHNESVRSDIDMGIEKAQKIIDRIVFACFAEDRGLLPDDTLRRVIKASDNSAFGSSLWSTFKGFFEAIDAGSEKLEIPNGYNGGLFATDATLNDLKVSDEPLRKVAKLSDYNFVEDLSVTILGHIFEQSVSDLEEIKNQVQVSQNLDSIQQSRRKKDGIFYTPDYIVRYIVDNSLGAYLREEEERLKDEFKLKDDITDKNYEKRERQAYGKYQDFLQSVKVVDPACGSGAFLVYVFDYLMAENKRVENILGSTLFSSDDYVKSILQNNIYGVDLNEESVEITKLSLWLKSAQKGKKLTTLDGNIKSGNSLIEDSNIAGDKAFDWHNQFPEVFKNGGFDIVVGNPPYVSIRGQDADTRKYLKEHYEHSKGADLYVAFIEKSLRILKPNTYMSLICPNKFFGANYGKSIRRHLHANTNIFEIWDLKDDKVFADAMISTIVLNIKKDGKQGATTVIVGDTKKILDSIYDATEKIQIEQDFDSTAIINKLDSNPRLKSVAEVRTGVMGFEYWKMKDIIHRDKSSNSVPLYTNGNLRRYSDSWDSTTIDLYKEKYSAPYIELNRNYISENTVSLFERKPKIIVRGVAQEVSAIIDREGSGMLVAVHSVTPNDDKKIGYILAVINSNLINWYHLKTFYSVRIPQGSLKYPTSFFDMIPIADANESEQTVLSDLAETMEIANKQLIASSKRFQKLVSNEYGLDSWPSKLNKWWLLDFTGFVSAFKVKLSLQQKDELLGLFDKYRKELTTLDVEIKQNDQKINQFIYKLYGLEPSEITTIEGFSA